MAANTQVYGNGVLDFGIVPVTVSKATGIVAHRFLKADGSDYAATEDSSCGV